MNRRGFLKLGGGSIVLNLWATAGCSPDANRPPKAPARILQSTARSTHSQPQTDSPPHIMLADHQDHRRRLRNVAECNRSIRSCLRRHLVTDYLPGQVVYNLGEYPCRKPWNPDEWDDRQLAELSAAGIRLVQVHEEWNDARRLFGADKFTPLNEAGFRRFIDMVHRHGMKLIVYASSGYFDRRDPDFRPEWARGKDLVEIYFHYACCSPASTGWRAYLLPRLVRLLDDYGIDGFYNDLGGPPLHHAPPGDTDEVLAFEESDNLQGSLEDLLALIYSEVKRRAGIVKIHDGGNRRPAIPRKVYDYLWVGEAVSNADQMRQAVRNHEPYVVPCLDMSRATIDREDDLYLHGIPYMQFPLLLAGRPFTGERAAIPGINYPPEEKCFWTRHLRAIWKHYQLNPDGPHSYGWWDSCPGRPQARSTCYRWLKLYQPIVEAGTWAYLEITDSDFFLKPLPQNVVASAFANRDLFLVLANYSHTQAAVETAHSYVALDSADTPASTIWTLQPRSMVILKRAPRLA